MYCNQCGSQNADSARFCSGCGKTLSVAPAAPISQEATPMAVGSPVPQQIDQQTDGKAVASLILGVLALTCFWILTGIPAIVLGHISRSNIRKSMGRLKGEGMALAGLIMGYLSLAALPFILIIAAIAIPNLLRSRTAANEASAVASLRTIAVAAVTYESTYPDKGFPATLDEMADSGAIDSVLAHGSKAGYRFQYSLVRTGEQPGYFILATPITPGTTGVRSFCSDESGVIRTAERNEQCTPESPALQ